MYSNFPHWAHCDHLLTVITMYSACTHRVFDPLPPVSLATNSTSLPMCILSVSFSARLLAANLLTTTHSSVRHQALPLTKVRFVVPPPSSNFASIVCRTNRCNVQRHM